MDIRDFVASDSRDIADLFHDSVHGISTDLYSREQLEAWAPSPPDYPFWEARLRETRPFVAVLGGRAVGFIELEADGHIDCMYVHPHYQRRGVAAALFAHASHVAIARGCRTLYVEASIPAKAFFLKRGFVVLGENNIERGGQALVNYSMRGQAQP